MTTPTRFLGLALLCALSSGCVTNSYDKARYNVDAMMNRYSGMSQGRANGSLSGAGGTALKLPWAQARFCLERASSNFNNGKMSNATDTIMLVAAGLAGGVGSASYAASTLVEDPGTQSDWAQVGGINIAVTAAVLGLRTALDLGNVGKEQRTAAADQAEAAVAILEQAALQLEEPGSAAATAWHTCTEGERRIAQVLARNGAADAIKDALEEAKSRLNEAKQKKEDAAATRNQAKTALPMDGTNSIKKAEAAAKVAQAVAEEAAADVLLAKARLAEARLEVLKGGSQLRRAVLFYSEAEVNWALEDLAASQARVTAARDHVKQREKALDDARASEAKAAQALKDQLTPADGK